MRRVTHKRPIESDVRLVMGISCSTQVYMVADAVGAGPAGAVEPDAPPTAF